VVKVGIPRALLYYQYFPAWKVFFEALDAEPVLSPPTNKAIFTAGNPRAVAETCLPVKLFFGHAISLVGKCDYMFIPAMRSLGQKAYYCSKFIGLPDMTSALVPECPPILDPEIDLNKGRRTLNRAIYDLGHHFTSDKGRIKKAAGEAESAHLAYRKELSDKGIMPVEVLGRIHRGEDTVLAKPAVSPGLSIAVIGHQYVVYDDYISHRLVSRLQAMGVRVLTPEMVEQGLLDIAASKLAGTAHWSFEADIVGAGEHYLNAQVDGIISVAVFGCGPDSMMVELVRHRAGELRVPFLHLGLDEHTSEGGLVTRLEAFFDMVRRKKRVCG
jgi:predicted nucleotide-binding protein (sugar kinase/HSP70/actin superfamily)